MEKKTTPKKSQLKPQMTLLQAIETIAERSKDSNLSDDFMKSVKTEAQFLAKKYGITERQAVLFTICMEKGPNNVDFRDIANHLDVSRIAVLRLAPDIDALVHRRLLRYRDAKEEDCFDVSAAVIRCLKHNEVYELPSRKGLDCPALFELLEQWFQENGVYIITISGLTSSETEKFIKNFTKTNHLTKVPQGPQALAA